MQKRAKKIEAKILSRDRNERRDRGQDKMRPVVTKLS
jgi:hypothetical protein